MIKCKNCVFWRITFGQNMLHAPRSKPHACTLRYHEVTHEDGETQRYPSRDPSDPQAPTFGMRTKPKDGCGSGVPKRKPLKSKKTHKMRKVQNEPRVHPNINNAG